MTTQRMLPLYEAKMIHQFDHRWATFSEDGTTREVSIAEKELEAFEPQPRYWVREVLVEDRLGDRDAAWLTAWRGIARTTDSRTSIASMIPRYPGGGNFDFMMCKSPEDEHIMLACFNSFVFDFTVRQKMTNMHFQFSIAKQLPLPAPSIFDKPAPWGPRLLGDWVTERTRELVPTSTSLASALDVSRLGAGAWDVGRRFLLRAELDAAFFHLYGVERDDVDYIMETFPIVKRKDIAAHGEYRTKRVILEIYDAMQDAIDTGMEYQTVLDPPPGEGPPHESEMA